MTIKSQNQLLRPEDRLALRMESEFKTRNQQQFPDPFDAYVFIDHITEEVVRTARSNVASSTTTTQSPTTGTTNILKCRVFDQNFYHAGLNNPLDAKSRIEYQTAINQCQEGYIRIDHSDVQNLTNGSIWSCTIKDQTIQLLSLVQASAFSFNPKLGKVTGGPSDAFKSGIKNLLGLNPRIPGSTVEIKFKNNRSSLINQSKRFPYKDFLPVLSEKLTGSGYSQTSITVTSMFRGPTAQVNAMMSGRISQGDSQSYIEFKKWTTMYRTNQGREVQAIIAEKDWSTDVAGLKSRLITKLTEQYNAGIYISNHMESGAIDLRTNDLEWSDVQSILSSLKDLKAAGHIRKYQLENARENENSKPPSPEHIHFSLTSKGGPGE